MELAIDFKNQYIKLLSDCHKKKFSTANKECMIENSNKLYALLELASEAINEITSSKDEISEIKNLVNQIRVENLELISNIDSRIEQSLKTKEVQSTEKEPPTQIGSYSNAVKMGPVLLVKPTTTHKLSNTAVSEQMSTLLSSVKVNKSRVTKNGAVVVDFPDQQSLDNAEKNLKTFCDTNTYTTIVPKKLLPKVTLVRVPEQFSKDNLIINLFEKNEA
jgi:hypothetical protein